MTRINTLVVGLSRWGSSARNRQGAGQSAPTCFGKRATIVGAGDITGTPGNDVIVGSAGADTIDALGAMTAFVLSAATIRASGEGWATTSSTAAPGTT